MPAPRCRPARRARGRRSTRPRPSRRSRDSASLAGVPRRSATKSRAISWSLRPVVRARGRWSRSPPAGSNASTSVKGNRVRSRSIACGGRSASVRVTWTYDASCRLWRGVGQQRLEVPAQPRQGPRDRRLDELRRGGAVRVEVDDPRALEVVGLGEGVGQRRAAVADPVGQGVPAVQVAEGDVVDAVEDPGRDQGDAADADVALGVAGLAAGDERVGQHQRAGAARSAGEVGADPGHRGAQGGLVRAPAQSPRLAQRVGLEVGDAVDGDGAGRVLEQHRGADRWRRRCG